VQFATTSNQYTVDLATWVRTSYGPDGGEGTSTFCGAFNKHPIAFAVPAKATMRVRIAIRVDVPGGEVTSATVATVPTKDTGGQPVSTKGAAEVQQAAQTTLASLVAGGGKSSAETAGTTVTCTIVNSSAPSAVTVSGGV
jgi:hypothetical protein